LYHGYGNTLHDTNLPTFPPCTCHIRCYSPLFCPPLPIAHPPPRFLLLPSSHPTPLATMFPKQGLWGLPLLIRIYGSAFPWPSATPVLSSCAHPPLPAPVAASAAAAVLQTLWGLPLLSRIYGSALPRALTPALVAGLITLGLTFVSEPVRSLWAHPFAYNAFVLLVSFVLTFRFVRSVLGV
jgi:hypothetical protein